MHFAFLTYSNDLLCKELTINVHDIILTHIDIFNWKRSKIANYKLIQKAFVTKSKQWTMVTL